MKLKAWEATAIIIIQTEGRGRRGERVKYDIGFLPKKIPSNAHLRSGNRTEEEGQTSAWSVGSIFAIFVIFVSVGLGVCLRAVCVSILRWMEINREPSERSGDRELMSTHILSNASVCIQRGHFQIGFLKAKWQSRCFGILWDCVWWVWIWQHPCYIYFCHICWCANVTLMLMIIYVVTAQ